MKQLPAPRWALPVAVLGSVALHALLLLAPWSRPHVAAQSKVRVIEARLLLAEAAPAAAKPASEPPAPSALPAPPLPQQPPELASPPPVVAAPVEPASPPPRPPAASAPARPTSPAPSDRAKPAEPGPAPASQAAQTPVAPPAPAAAPVESPGVAPVTRAPTVYVPASELDPPPRPLTEIRLAYPPGAGFRSGQVVLDLLIGASGTVEDVKVIESSTPGLFEASAITAFVVTRFAPGLQAGIPVAARMRVAVQYSAGGMGMSISGADGQLQPAGAAPR